MSDVVKVEIVDTKEVFKWRLVVNGIASYWFTSYETIYCFKGYCVATDYWSGTFKAMIPFKVRYV